MAVRKDSGLWQSQQHGLITSPVMYILLQMLQVSFKLRVQFKEVLKSLAIYKLC